MLNTMGLIERYKTVREVLNDQKDCSKVLDYLKENEEVVLQVARSVERPSGITVTLLKGTMAHDHFIAAMICDIARLEDLLREVLEEGDV